MSLMLMEVRCRQCREVLAVREGEGLRLKLEGCIVAPCVAATLRCPHCSPSADVVPQSPSFHVSRRGPVSVTLFPKA